METPHSLIYDALTFSGTFYLGGVLTHLTRHWWCYISGFPTQRKEHEVNGNATLSCNFPVSNSDIYKLICLYLSKYLSIVSIHFSWVCLLYLPRRSSLVFPFFLAELNVACIWSSSKIYNEVICIKLQIWWPLLLPIITVKLISVCHQWGCGRDLSALAKG